MNYDPENPFPGMDKSDPETIKKYFEDEKFHVLHECYSKILKAKSYRRSSMRFFRELSDRFRDVDPVVPYLALTIFDYISSFLLFPKRLLKRENGENIFVTCCFVSAWRMRDCEFSPCDYEMYENLNASDTEMDEFVTEIEDRNFTPPVTALCFLDFLLGLLTELDKTQMTCLKSFATHKLYALKYDMRLVEFQPSIMAAAAQASSVNTFYKIKMEHLINKFCNCDHLNKEFLKRSVEMLIPVVTVCIPESPDHVMSDRFPKELSIIELLGSLYADSNFHSDTAKPASPEPDAGRRLRSTEASSSGKET